MRRHRKLIILIGTILAIILGSIFYIDQYKNNNINENNNNLYKLLEYTEKNEIDNFDTDELNKIKNELDNILADSKNESEVSKANFILGYLYLNEKKYDDAINRLNKSIDSFKYVKNSKMKSQAYYELSRAYLNKKEYTKSDEAFEQMKIISENLDCEDEIVKYSMCRSYDIYVIPDGKNNPVDILEEALELAKEIDYEELEKVYFALGRAYWSADRIIESTNTKLEALNIARSKNNEEKISQISTDIGIDYLYSGNYPEAITYLSRVLSYNLDDEKADAKAKSYSLMNLFEAYIKAGDYDEARETLDKLEKKIDEQKDGKYKEDCITYTYINMADLEIQTGNTSEALELLNLGKERFEKRSTFNFYDFDVKLLEIYGDYYYKIGNYEKALEYHKDAEEIADLRGLTYLEQDHNNKIYLDYKAIGDYENTIKYLEDNNELKSKLASDKDRQYSQYLMGKFESEKSADEISKLQEYKETMILIFVVLCVVTIFISIFTYAIYKKNREINRLNKLFKALSITDSLTKVQNRRALDEYLAGNWALYKETHMPISFMMIDIDFFKKYNDNYGHPEGDKVLESVASTIKHSCRNSDFVARYGGEEFIIIMLNTDKNEAINLVNRIRKNINISNLKHEYSDVSDRITLSVGITTAYIGTDKNYQDYIKKADDALYESKQKGRDTYTFLT